MMRKEIVPNAAAPRGAASVQSPCTFTHHLEDDEWTHSCFDSIAQVPARLEECYAAVLGGRQSPRMFLSYFKESFAH